MARVLGLDIGIGSCGWAVVELPPIDPETGERRAIDRPSGEIQEFEILACGARCFDLPEDPKTKELLNKKRRLFRGQRRVLGRRRQRMRAVRSRLARQGRLRLGTTDAFFRDRLTGRFQTDIATASRTSLMNLEDGAWDPELCALFGVPMDCLPEIGPTSGDLGTLPGGARLAASIVDQQAALYGHGCRRPGAAKVTFGTGAFVQCLTADLVRPARPGPLPTVAWQREGEPIAYALDGGVYAAASAVNWARDLGLFTDHAEISGFAAPPAIDRGLVFVPALVGLGCPHWQRATRGAWAGLELGHGKADLMQALLEGVALRTAEVLEAMRALHPLTGPVSVDGGLSRNGYFVSFLSEVAGQDLILPEESEQTAAGLARLAAEACGVTLAPPAPGRLVRGRSERRADRLMRFGRVRQGLSDLAQALGEARAGDPP